MSTGAMETGSLGSSLSPAALDRLRHAGRGKAQAEVAKRLTSFFMKQLVDQMWKTVPEGGLVSQSSGEKVFRSFFNEQMAVGLARVLPIGGAPERKNSDWTRTGVQNRPPIADIQSGGGLA